ncbi:MAG: AlkA N-terminal domain-containing protein [Ilumatobacteraceae bacterium]
MRLDDDQCYRAVEGRDPRFDGWFVTAVRTTGIYCRPSCPAATPKRRNVEFFATAATAQHHGYRACKRCRPDATPGSPEWNLRADAVARAMRLIADGLVDREGVGGLAARLGYSERQVHRLLVGELGVGAIALARAQRAQTARILLENTVMSVAGVAFAAGFGSVRQCNDTLREVYDASPSDLRRGVRNGSAAVSAGEVHVRLAVRAPFDADAIFRFLATRAVPGVEEAHAHEDGSWSYRRSLRLARGAGVVTVHWSDSGLSCSLALDDVADLPAAVQRTRRLFDLDADPSAITGHLGTDPLLGPLVAARPGLRSPGHPDGAELLVRAVLGQQVSVAGARTLAARLVESDGEPLRAAVGAVTHLFPSAQAVAAVGDDRLAMPRARADALRGACGALATGSIVLDAGSDRDEAGHALLALPGIGPWTVGYVRMRALGDPDVFLPTDIGVRNGLRRLGAASGPRDASAHAEQWRPWRSYALHHLWTHLGG